MQALVKQRAEDFGIDNPHYKCLPDGPNYSTGGGMKRFLQTPAMIAILQEDLTYRVIHMDGRALETDPNPSWMGYSVGHWEGDTLVVESNGYNDRTWLLGGYPHTEALRMTERVRRPRTVEVTFSDGKLFVSLNGGPKQPVVPQSETNFSGTGLSYQFVRDGNGIATHLVEGHISGDYKFETPELIGTPGRLVLTCCNRFWFLQIHRTDARHWRPRAYPAGAAGSSRRYSGQRCL